MYKLKIHDIYKMSDSIAPAISAYFDFSATREENYIHIEHMLQAARSHYSDILSSTCSLMTSQLADRLFENRSFLERPRSIAYFCSDYFEGYFPLRELLWEGVVLQDGFYLEPIEKMMNRVESFQVVSINSKRAIIYQSCGSTLHQIGSFQAKCHTQDSVPLRDQITEDIVSHSFDDYVLSCQQLFQSSTTTDQEAYTKMFFDVERACRFFSGYTVLVGNPMYTLNFFKQSQLTLPNLLLINDLELEYATLDKLHVECLQVLSSYVGAARDRQVMPIIDSDSFRNLAS